MLETAFLQIIFTISTNFFYLLMFPAVVSFPLFFGWVLPPKLRWGSGIIALPIMLIYGYLAMTKLEPVLSWIHQTGESGELVFAQHYASGNMINNEPEMVFAGTLKTSGGELIAFKISAGGVLSYPLEGPLALQTHRTYPVKYRPAYPKFWIIDRGTSEEVQLRQFCQNLRSRENELKAVLLLKPQDQGILLQMATLQAEILEKKCDEASSEVHEIN